VTCTLTAYAPHWWVEPQGNVIVASAAVECDATGAVGYAGAPTNGNFPEVTSPNTYVSAPPPGF
jgi:hypothetical protein